MKKYIYILLLLPALILSACTDDLGLNRREENLPEDDGVGIPFTIQVEDFGERTRSVDFTENAIVKINTAWIGVFNRTPGVDGKHKLETFTEADQRFYEISSGKEYQNLIRAQLDAPEKKDGGYGQYIILCVVNYQDVLVYDESGNKTTLQEKLQNLQDWEEFVNLAVDTSSAYEYPHDADSPIMAGFLRIRDGQQRSSTHVQVDQFNGNELFPSKFMEKESGKFTDTDITLSYSESDGYETSGKIILLRRLVTNINVNIEVENPNIQLTEVKYRRYNLPQYVYVIERRTVGTDEAGEIKVPSEVEHAANFADKLWYDDHSKGYYDDKEWNIAPNRNAQTGEWNFSFQHFANKHWARTTPQEYSDREKREKIGTYYDEEDKVNRYKYLFTALAEDKNDFNNNASYFVIKMRMVNTTTNQCAEAEYTIHEGYTSDETGTKRDYSQNPAAESQEAWEKYILKDFSSARNINTTYNIKVRGFNNIFLNVNNSLSSEEKIKSDHFPGEGGTVWELIYFNDPSNDKSHFYRDNIFDKAEKGHFINVLKGTKGSYDNEITKNEVTNNYWKFEDAIHFGPNPNISFRLYGYSKYRKTGLDKRDAGPGITGYNYNFSSDSFNHLDGLWPASAGDYSHYFNPEDDENEINNNLPEDLRNGVLIAEHGTENYMTLGDFVKIAASKTTDMSYDVYITQSNLSDDDMSAEDRLVEGGMEAVKDNYVRAIYICDRNGVEDDVDGCSRKVTVYCAAQYPDYSGHSYDMVYAIKDNKNILPYNCDGATYTVKNNLPSTHGWDNNGIGMVFSNNPDLAFRLIGFNDQDEFVDLCYNFDLNEFNQAYPKFASQWDANSGFTKSTNLNDLDNFSNTMNGLKIHTRDGDVLTLKNFIETYPATPPRNPIADGFTVGNYEHGGEVMKYIRKLYIFDKNALASPNIKDESIDETYYQIFAVQQQPYDTRPDAPQVTPLWHNRSVAMPTPANQAAGFDEWVQTYNWCGVVNSMVEIEWQIATGYTQYELVIGDRDPIIVDAPQTGSVVKYQLVTAGFDPGSYDVSINPVGTKPSVRNKQSNKLVLTDSKWNFNDMPIAKKVIDMLKTRDDSPFQKDGLITNPAPWNNDGRGFANVNFELNGLHFINGKTQSEQYCLRGANPSGLGYCFQTTFQDASRSSQSLMFYITTSGKLEIEFSGVGGTGNGELATGNRYFIFDIDGGNVISKNGMTTPSSSSKGTMTQHIDFPNDGRKFTALYIYSYKAFRYYSIKFTPDN